jgi:hypothetical protein
MRIAKRRHLALIGAVALSAAAGLAFTAQPAAAANTCNESPFFYGYQVGVCINQLGTAAALSEIYVNSWGGWNISCHIDIESWDDQGHKVATTTSVECTKGYHPAIYTVYAYLGTCVNAHTHAVMYRDGQTSRFGDSKTVRLCRS